jgi:histidine kinase
VAMPLDNKKLRSSLITEILISVGAVLLVALSAWSYFNINYVEKKFMDDLLDNMDRLSNTIRLGMHYAMMTNSRDDIKETINNISRQNEIENIRIYNKQGRIKFSNQADEVGPSNQYQR